MPGTIPVAPVVPVAPVIPVVPPAPAAVVPAEPAKTNPWDDPTVAKAEIERLRKENGSDRVNAKAQAATDARNEFAQTIGKALGLIKADETVDPAKLAEQLTASGAETRKAQVALAVYQAAGTTADPGALLDSTSFLASLKDIDPSDSAAMQTAITAAVESNPRLGAAPGTRLPASNPAQGSSGSGSALSQLSRSDLDHMTPEAIVEAKQAGRFNSLMGIRS